MIMSQHPDTRETGDSNVLIHNQCLTMKQRRKTSLNSGFSSLHLPDIVATGFRSSLVIVPEERRFDFLWFRCTILTRQSSFSSPLPSTASQVGSGGGSHPRLTLLTLASLHALAAFLTNYSMSQAWD